LHRRHNKLLPRQHEDQEEKSKLEADQDITSRVRDKEKGKKSSRNRQDRKNQEIGIFDRHHFAISHYQSWNFNKQHGLLSKYKRNGTKSNNI
jgi:hypothetical protein